MVKKIATVLAVLVVIAAGALYFLYSSLDGIVKAAIEDIGSDVTGTRVELAEVELSPTSGEGTLRGFRVTNPDGFDSSDAFRFDEVRVKVDIATIASDPVVIDEITVVNPVITYEIGDSSTNVDTLKGNVDRYGDGGQESDSEGPNIVIRNLYMTGGEVKVAASGLGESPSVPLPDIHLTDIGTDGKGATPAEVTAAAVDAIADSAADAVGSLDLEGLAGDALESAGEAASEAGSAVEDAAEDAAGAVESLFE